MFCNGMKKNIQIIKLIENNYSYWVAATRGLRIRNKSAERIEVRFNRKLS